MIEFIWLLIFIIYINEIFKRRNHCEHNYIYHWEQNESWLECSKCKHQITIEG